jgi:hypothetical protein
MDGKSNYKEAEAAVVDACWKLEEEYGPVVIQLLALHLHTRVEAYTCDEAHAWEKGA